MSLEITMPQLSDTMTEGKVIKWLKKEGDKVSTGDKVAEVETDKAVMEMESFAAGTLAAVLAKEGEKVAVGAVLAVVATGKEDPAEVKKQAISKALPLPKAPPPPRRRWLPSRPGPKPAPAKSMKPTVPAIPPREPIRRHSRRRAFRTLAPAMATGAFESPP